MSEPATDHPRSHPEKPRPRAAQVAGIALTAAVALSASTALAWSLRRWHERPEPAVAVADRASVTTDRRAVVIGTGRLAYQVHCARCHGVDGHGDGPDAERLDPPPRDFASDRWRLAPTRDAVRQSIRAGIAGTAMPGWGDSLSRLELEGLVAHVLSLAPAPRPRAEARSADGLVSPELAALLDRAGFVVEPTPRSAPALGVRDLDGKTTTLAGRLGRPVLVLFWGTTCGHCPGEILEARRFADRHRDRGLDVLPICVDETDAAIVRDVAGPGCAERPLYLDSDGTARLRYDVQSLPTFALIDRSGRLIARAQGARDWSGPDLDNLIRRGLVPSGASASP